MLGKDYEGQDCALARALEVVGERWTLLIVRDAFYGVRRFNDFQAHLDIPKAVLSDRLAGLVYEEILERRPDPEHAGRHLYELTAAGRDLWPVLAALLGWGGRHRQTNSRVFRHAARRGRPLRALRADPAAGGHRDRAPPRTRQAPARSGLARPTRATPAAGTARNLERYAAEDTSPGCASGAGSSWSTAAARASRRLRRLSR
jgi:DNA-binding HxlR family transcriptional regulator